MMMMMMKVNFIHFMYYRVRKYLEFQLIPALEFCLPWVQVLALLMTYLAFNLPDPFYFPRRPYLSWTTGLHFFGALILLVLPVSSVCIVLQA